MSNWSFHILHFTCPLHRYTVRGPSTTICRWYPAVHGNFIWSFRSRSHQPRIGTPITLILVSSQWSGPKSRKIWSYSPWHTCTKPHYIQTQVNVAGASIPLSTTIKLLGVHLDNSLTFSNHVNSVSKSCHFHLRALRHIRSTLDLDAAKLIGHALVSSRLDYCNSILYGAPELSISKLQRVQNALARVVLQKNSATSAGPLLNSLHWLPVLSRINFKIATITYKSLHSQSPGYLASMLHHYIPTT